LAIFNIVLIRATGEVYEGRVGFTTKGAGVFGGIFHRNCLAMGYPHYLLESVGWMGGWVDGWRRLEALPGCVVAPPCALCGNLESSES
jgi:hypothetical protein